MISKVLHPEISAYVSASAGSGKTKLLIDRILSLMLAGLKTNISPSQLLCITYTRAATKEILDRLISTLEVWNQQPDDVLIKSLSSFHYLPSLNEVRSLYKKVLENPPQIRTIHGFCQEFLSGGLLQKEVLDPSEAQRLFDTAAYEIIQEWGPGVLTWGKFQNFKEEIFSEKARLLPFFKEVPPQDLSLWRKGREGWIQQSEATLHQACASLNLPFLSLEELGMCLEKILTKEGDLRAHPKPLPLPNFSIPDILSLRSHLREEQVRLSQDLHLGIARLILCRYQEIKDKKSVADYDDLLFQAYDKLQDPLEGPSLMERLHNQIKHILIDEAQDTSPLQWKIILSLVQGLCVDAQSASIVIVGDEKQSIYSFQGADLKVYQHAIQEIRSLIRETQGEEAWADLSLETSFRSRASILSFVDAVFSTYPMDVTSETVLSHKSARGGGGEVQLLPPSSDLELGALLTPILNTFEDVLILFRKREGMGELRTTLNRMDLPVRQVDRIFPLENPDLALLEIAARWVLDPASSFCFEILARFGVDFSKLKAIPEEEGTYALDGLADLLEIGGDQVDSFLESLPSEKTLADLLFGFKIFHSPFTMEETEDLSRPCIRLLTIHGAKGLQAEAVVLRDLNSAPPPPQEGEILWDSRGVPLIVPPKTVRLPTLDPWLKKARLLQEQENQRLLYVALTRAREALFIAPPEDPLRPDGWGAKLVSVFEKWKTFQK